MNFTAYASLGFLLFSTCYIPSSLANDTGLAESMVESDISQISVASNSNGPIFTSEMRKIIKREVMSKPGVMLSMADLTDSGYTWTNDVLWVGTGLPVHEKWYIAGFMFQRPGYNSIWLQYAFTLSKSTGELTNFKPWYGRATFR